MNAKANHAGRWLVPTVGMLSCAYSSHHYAALSSGPIGCPVSEVVVSHHASHLSGQTWVATCRGRRFFCTGSPAGVTCSPEMEPAQAWVPPPYPPPVAVTPAATRAPVPQPPARPTVTVVVVAPEAPVGDAVAPAEPPIRESPDRTEVQTTLATARGRLLACTGGMPSSVQTAIVFRGRTGRPTRVTVTTDSGVDVATCIGQALLGAAVAPFTLESLTVSYPWRL